MHIIFKRKYKNIFNCKYIFYTLYYTFFHIYVI